MNENEIKELVRKFTAKIAESPPNYDLFLTKQGKNFQIEVIDLMESINLNNIFPAIPDIIPILLKGLKEKIDNLDEEIELNAKMRGIIINSEITTFRNLIDKLANPITYDEKNKIIISNTINRFNSYYFLAIFAHMDYYANSIHQEILDRYSAKQSSEYFATLRKKLPLEEILKKIRVNLIKGIAMKIKDLPEVKPWSETFNNMLNLRHEFAHKNSKARRELLDEKFNRISQEVRDKSKEEFNKFLISLDSSNELKSELYNSIKPFYETLLILKKIGEECMVYLALHDHLIAEFFNTQI